MREIKFRVWDKVDKVMVTVERLNFSERGELKHVGVDFGGTDIAYVPVGFMDLMQYTGLYDNNGKEIYEGDVVRVFGGECHYGCWEHDEKMIVDGLCCDFIISDILYGFENIEVIGNIYENPELLEVHE